MLGWIVCGIGITVFATVVLISAYLFHAAVARREDGGDVSPRRWPDGSIRRRRAENMRLWRERLLRDAHEEVSVTAHDGLTLRGVFFPAASRKVVIFVHGYRGRGLDDFAELAQVYRENQFNLLFIDQRACGRSEGRYITFGVLERRDVCAWMDDIRTRFAQDCAIILHGVSLGGTTVLMASALASPGQICGIVDDCGFTSPWDILAHVMKTRYHLPPFPFLYLASGMAKIVAGFGFREASACAAMRSCTLPVLFIHGDADDFVPTEMSRLNYAACASAHKTLVLIPGAEHAVSFTHARTRYREALTAFLRRVLPQDKDGGGKKFPQ